jgi:hypothetical protein
MDGFALTIFSAYLAGLALGLLAHLTKGRG